MTELEQLWQQAVAAQQRQDWLAAEQAFRGLLAIAPGRPEFLHGLAYVLFDRGDRAAGIELLRSALGTQPAQPELQCSLGTLLRRDGQAAAAAACFETALHFEPRLWQARYNLGNALRELGQLEQAALQYEAVLQQQSGDADVFYNLGVVQLQLKQLPKARSSLRRAIDLNPQFADAWLQLGHLERAGGDLLTAASHYRRAVGISPRTARLWHALGRAQLSGNDTPAAIASLERGVSLEPEVASGWAELGNAYEADGQAMQAVRCFSTAAQHSSDDTWTVKAALTFPIIMESACAIEETRTRLDLDLSRLAQGPLCIDDPVSNIQTPAFALAYHGRDERQFQTRIAQTLARAMPSLEFVAPHCREGVRRPPGRIRVGFISTYFHDHTISKLNAGLIEHFDRSRFEPIVLRVEGPDDAMARRLSQAGDRCITLRGDLALARAQIADQQLDVSFYTDIGIAALTYYLAHARLAPVQCVTWGHPLTTGIAAVDYFISSDALEVTGSEVQYTERLVRLPRLANYYNRPRPTRSVRTRESFGLGEVERVYACLQSPFKLHPDDDRIFASILEGDPAGVLLLLESPFRNWTELLQKRFAAGMPDVAHRIRFISQQPPDEYSRLISLVDALFDPVHFGGGDTTYQSFGVGAPVATLSSHFLRGRITTALYQQLGIDDLVASSPQDYVSKILRLANDRVWRETLRGQILNRSSEVFENLAGVRALEDFLERTVRNP